ncbi:MAG: PQQ-binding-like beta-propeller repeat protein [Chloroflexi bacterium]|nr:PQQ-binding-like beta-propeller repeat protein [Chloroflexota bacterium]
MYAAKRPLRRPAIFLLIVASYLLVACGVQTGNTNWPGLSTDGQKVYVAYGPGVIAYDVETQSEIWSYPAESSPTLQFFAAPSLQDGRIILGDFGASGGMLSPGVVVTLYALNDTEQGTPGESWKNGELVNDRIVAPPLQVGDQLFVGTANNYLLSIDAASGAKQWEFEAGHSIWGQPAYKDDVLYLSSLDKSIYALDAETGRELWQTELGGALASSPVVNTNLVYVASFDNKLHALDMQTGQEKWTAPAQDWIWDAPAFADGIVYFADIRGNVFAVDGVSGEQIWSQQLNLPVQTSPVVVDDTVYIASGDDIEAENPQGALTALDVADGKQRWQKTAPGPLYTTPVVVGDAIIVALQSEAALLVAFDLDTGGQNWVYTPPQE